MTKRRNKFLKKQSGLERIETKCDRILSEIICIRHHLMYRTYPIDDVIEKMHLAAKRLRKQCDHEHAAMCMRANILSRK